MGETSSVGRHGPVPPLPVVAGVHEEHQMPGGASILDVLVREHRALLELCDAVESAGPSAQIVREAAPTRPHPGLPTTAPLRRVVDPAVGAADKVIDLVTARHTRSQDL